MLIKTPKNTQICYIIGTRGGQHLDWETPKTLDDKLNILKIGLYAKDDLVIKCTDKYRVREYVKECGLAHILNELYGVWNDGREIDISELPDSFVLKRNNDCGGIVVVKDKDKEIDLSTKIECLGSGINRKYGLSTAEFHYQYIEPCIICEKFLCTEDGGFPYDYKFFAMNGTVRYALVCVGRKRENFFRFMVDRDFHLFPVMPKEKQVTNEYIQRYKPEIWEEMIQDAEILAKPFPFVRVDLYHYEGRVLFGELTFTPMGAVNTYINDIGQKIMGLYLEV